MSDQGGAIIQIIIFFLNICAQMIQNIVMLEIN